MNYYYVDLTVFAAANLINLLMVGIMLSRPFGLKRLERIMGWLAIILAIPLATAAVLNIVGGREWWAFVLPTLMVLFLIVELVIDYILKLDFRYTRWLGPYLALYYLAQWGLIGYSFLIDVPYGMITLVTYFLSLFATWYSYRKVSHG